MFDEDQMDKIFNKEPVIREHLDRSTRWDNDGAWHNGEPDAWSHTDKVFEVVDTNHWNANFKSRAGRKAIINIDEEASLGEVIWIPEMIAFNFASKVLLIDSLDNVYADGLDSDVEKHNHVLIENIKRDDCKDIKHLRATNDEKK